MKKTLLKFRSLPPMTSRRFRLGEGHYRSTAYKTDGGADDDDDDDEEKTPEQKLLMKIEKRTAKQLRAAGFQNAEAVTKLVTDTLTGLNLEALRKYETDKTELETSVRNLAAELAKNKPTPGGEAKREFRTGPLKELLEKNMDKIGKVMRAKEPGQMITLSTRAAATMEMNDAIEEPVDMPDDIIESFSVDAFAKKRRPNEYIFQIANRRTVPEISEYKTWLEEGDEDGAFALVEEGELKPLMSKKLVRNFAKYKKVAGKRVYTEEFAKFRKEAYRIIEDLFNDQIMRNYSALLTTDLLAKAAAYVGTALDGQYATPTDFHAIGAVAAQIETLEFHPDLLIINPQDKWRIGLSQTEQGIFYMNVPSVNPAGEVTMMGFTVFTTNRMPVGQAMLGESGLFKIEDEAVQVRLGYGINVTKNGGGLVTDVESDVDHNRFRIIAEAFFMDWIATNHTGSFVYFNFADVKEALTA